MIHPVSNRKTLLFSAWLCVSCLFFFSPINAQKRRPASRLQAEKQRAKSAPAIKSKTLMAAVVVEERLAVLRFEPGFAAPVLQRLRNGRELLITNQKQVDGVTFYAVKLPPEKSGWVQADAVVSSARAGDDARLARLIQASDGFDKIERAALFLENFPRSIFRPAILLLLGDLIEESAQKLSRDAKRHFESEETRASGAPLYSFYLSYNGLDRYRRLGVNFALDRAANQFHYDGASWREIIEKHPHAAEAVEARKRLTTLNLAIK